MSDGTTRTEAGVWVAHGFSFLRYRATRRTVTLPSGERALIRVDDSGTVTEIERSRRGAGVSRAAGRHRPPPHRHLAYPHLPCRGLGPAGSLEVCDRARAEEYRRVRAEAMDAGAELTPEAAQAIRGWHERNSFECAAHNEGQYCCLDYLLGDTKEESCPEQTTCGPPSKTNLPWSSLRTSWSV